MKFCLLLARQRSGTGAFGRVIGKHPDLHFTGEIFHPDNVGEEGNYFTWLERKVARDPKASHPYRNRDNWYGFLSEDMMRYPGRTPVADVKYSSLHQMDGGWQEPTDVPWLLFHAMKLELPVIHLTRANYVETFVSGKLAEANRVWHAEDRDAISVNSTVLNIRELCAYLEMIDRDVMLVKHWIKDYRRALVCDYADLFDEDGNFSAVTAQSIATLLDVPPFVDLAPDYVKQAPHSLRDSVENFDLLQKALAGTRFEWMVADIAPLIGGRT
jgi:hypothetical protein